jgi:hypothetical protein
MAEAIQQQRVISATTTFASQKRHSQITSDQLSERWNIGTSQAKNTLEVTTQRGVRSAILPLSRRYRTDRMYNQRKLRNQNFILTHCLESPNPLLTTRVHRSSQTSRTLSKRTQWKINPWPDSRYGNSFEIMVYLNN